MLEYIGSIGGIAGVLAVIIFWMYRAQDKQMRDDRKYMEDRLSKLIEDYNESTRENTKVLSELFLWLKLKNGNPGGHK